MANKREFKKYADVLGAAAIDEMVSAFYNVPGADRDKISQAIEKVLCAVTKAKDNANVTFDRGVRAFGGNLAEYSKSKKAYFKALFDKIETELTEDVNSALKLFNEALPEEERARNKAAAV